MTAVRHSPGPGRPGPRRSVAGRLGLAVLSAACVAATGVQAQAPTVAFDIPSQPIGAALVAFAVQAKISLGLKGVGACLGPAAALVGRYTIEGALAHLLAHSGCAYRRLDDRAFDIVAAARPAAATAAAKPSEPARRTASGEVSELVVVATQRVAAASRLAYAVSSLSDRALRRHGVRDISDIALLSPAMTVTNLGMGRDKVLLRGLSDGPLTGLTSSLVGVYLDDTRLTFNAPDPDLRLTDIDRVEVLRGPQGALYGAGSLTGVVRIVPAEPDPHRWSTTMAATGSQTDGGRPSGSIEGMINAPFLDGRAAIRLVGYHEVDGGYIHDIALDNSHANRTQRDGGRVAARVDFNDRWSLTAGALMQDIAAADTQYSELAHGPYARSVFLAEPHDNDFREVHLRLAGASDWGNARVSVAYVRHGLFSRYDATPVPPVPVPPGPAAFDERDRIKSVVTETMVTSRDDRRFRWLAGAVYAHTWADSYLTLTSLAPPTAVGYQELRNDSLDEGALYGQATERLYRGLELTLGGRLFASGDQVRSADTTVAGQPSTLYAGRVGQTGFAPKIVLSDRLSPWPLVYAQADEGYRAPGVNTAAAPTEPLHVAGGSEPLRVFKGDNLVSLEAGAKLTGLGGRLRLDMAIYQVEWRDILSDQLLPSGLPYTANVGHARNLGVEAEAAFRAGGFEVGASLLLDEPELDKVNPAFPILSQNGLGAVPDDSFAGWLHYDRRLWADWSVAFDTRWSYVGASHLMLNIASLPRMGDYTTGRLATTLSNDRWRVTLAVDNPADVQGNTFAYGNPFTVRFRQQITPLRPRTITLGVAVAY